MSHLLKRDSRWGSRDRKLIAETVYECVRWWRYLAYLADDERPEAVVAAHWAFRYGEALDVSGFPLIHPQELDRIHNAKPLPPAVKASYPDWMYELGAQELGKDWPVLAKALNQKADVFLRVNTLKTDRQRLKDALEARGLGLAWEDRGASALRILERKNLWATPEFKSGHFEVQDIASQQVAPQLDVEPGMTVIDACAGAGGKTLHLAALMENKGRLIALDTEPRKLVELKKRAKRAGVSNLEVREIKSSKTIKRLYGKADRVLLDVPCSGMGVLRRNPDAKWKLKSSFVQEVKGWQHDILSRYSRMLKLGGKLVYATCSVLPSESEDQVARFLEEQEGNWNVEHEQRYSPLEDYDGFYVALLGQSAEG